MLAGVTGCVAVVGGAVLVGAGEGVDAVVVFSVGKGAEFVEEGLGVAAADELDEPVFGGGGDGPGAGDLVAGGQMRSRRCEPLRTWRL